MIDVAETFQEHEILLTGANGFLGKVVLGLLLDRYPGIRHVHLLLRPGPFPSSLDRFKAEILRSPALAATIEKHGKEHVLERTKVWTGDVGRAACGLAERDVENLAGRARLIVNCAGRVAFFPPVDDSFSANVDGVENIIELARCLEAKLLHVSTAFVCGEADGLVEETEPVTGFYPRRRGVEDRSFNYAEELRFVRGLIGRARESERNTNACSRTREVAQSLAALGKQRATAWGWTNTYTYAKSLGEQIIAASDNLEYAIVRPAIVESAWRFPFPGWIEGGRTAAPLVLMVLGGLRDWPVRGDAPLEVVPVDMVASAVLVIAAALLSGRHEPVYQLGSADVNPLELAPLVRLLTGESRRLRRNGLHSHPLPLAGRLVAGSLRRPSPKFVSADQARERREKLQRRVRRAQVGMTTLARTLEKTRLPGADLLADWRRALRALDLQASFREQTIDQYLPFVLHNRFLFESRKIRRALELIDEADRRQLLWAPERIDWKHYWTQNQIPGILKWVQPQAVREWSFRI